MLIHVLICVQSDFITTGNIEQLLFRSHNAIYRMSQEEWVKLQESVPYVKLYRYNPKHLYPKLNGYGDLRFIYEEDIQCVSLRLGRQGAFKSSALWCVRAGKGLTRHFDISGFHCSVDEIFTFLSCDAKYVGSCLTMF